MPEAPNPQPDLSNVQPVAILTPSEALLHKYWLMQKQLADNMQQEFWQQLCAANNLDRQTTNYTVRIVNDQLVVLKIDAEGNLIL